MGAETREALTVRIPSELLAELRALKPQGESLNAVIIEALAREVAVLRGLHALDEIRALKGEQQARYGVLPSSVDLIREMREERIARLTGDLL